MPANDLHPSYLQLNYHSNFGLHKASLPTRKWNSGIGTNGQGGYVNWNGTPVDADDMVNDLVTLMLPLMPTAATFDNYVIFDSTDDDSPLFPVAGAALTAMVGTGAASWYGAVEAVFTFFDTGFNTSKLVLLDYNSLDNFARRNSATASVAEAALAAEWIDADNAWSSRSNLRPNVLRSISLGINDELKKQYPGV